MNRSLGLASMTEPIVTHSMSRSLGLASMTEPIVIDSYEQKSRVSIVPMLLVTPIYYLSVMSHLNTGICLHSCKCNPQCKSFLKPNSDSGGFALQMTNNGIKHVSCE